MERTLTGRRGANLLGVSVKTIQRWHREGGLKPAGRTVTGRRCYTEDQSRAFRHQRPNPPCPPKIVADCRVSSQRQRPNLITQRLALHCSLVRFS